MSLHYKQTKYCPASLQAWPEARDAGSVKSTTTPERPCVLHPGSVGIGKAIKDFEGRKG